MKQERSRGKHSSDVEPFGKESHFGFACVQFCRRIFLRAVKIMRSDSHSPLADRLQRIQITNPRESKKLLQVKVSVLAK